jgi:hypothetical protein
VVTVQSLGSYLTRIRRKEQLRPVPQTAPTSPVESTESKGVPRAQKKKCRFWTGRSYGVRPRTRRATDSIAALACGIAPILHEFSLQVMGRMLTSVSPRK